ncbi:MAG: T9SS type A sorting domain-containing protein [Polaribacter sp.]|uniref:T9SS type A sorting domain-containing protein n=1 Tax=Polaribacter sp. TaxID=1920175 RepID=UPI003EF26728
MNIKVTLYNYFINRKLAIAFIVCFIVYINIFLAQTSGPQYIKKTLTDAGAFNTPDYSFTTDYDAYKEYDNIKGLFIEALNYGENPSKVFAWYGVPENLAEGEKAPAVVLVHGGGGTAFPNWVEQWTSRGYIAIAIAHEGQLPGDKVDGWYQTWEFSGPRRAGFFRDADNDLNEQWFYHATADAILANSLLRSFPEVDATNIGINGISWGGVLTNVITGIDDRFKFSVPVYGCGYLYESPKYGVDMLVNTEAEKEFYFANWEPSLYMPLQNLPVFYVNGDNDKQFAMNIASKSFNLINSEKYLRFQHLMSHSTVAGYRPEEIYDFADYITKNDIAPLKVIFNNVSEDSVSASFEGNVKRAVLYYTSEVASWEQDSYDWLVIDAAVDEATNTITASLPEGTKYFYVNVFNSEERMYSSTMEEVINISSITTEVHIKATENTTYSSGIVTMTGIGSVEGLDSTFEVNITVTPNFNMETYPNAVIVSGVSDGNNTSSTKSWAISDDGANNDFGDRIFQGDQGFSATISSATVGNITGTSGLTSEDITIDTFKSITIVNAHNVGDRFTFSADGSTDFELGRFNGEGTKIVDLVAEATDTNIMSFTIKNGSTAINDKWSVDNIAVQVTVDKSSLTLGLNDVKNEAIAFRLYPNPANNQISFNMPLHAVKIIDVTGKELKTFSKETKNIDISGFMSGIYILKGINSEGKTIIKKFIKQTSN